MSDAAAADSNPQGKGKERTLEELMLAMDVVDTLRHRQGLVERELDAEGRRERLIDRLREIYTAQGIAVTDAVLEQGVLALEEERFAYEPPAETFSVRLARWYVNRDRWGKPVLIICGVLLAAALVYYLLVALPRAQERAELPRSLEQTFASIVQLDQENQASQQAQALLQSARVALDENAFGKAQRTLEEMRELRERLAATFELRIVARPNEMSGVWRIPDVNEQARNYYLIVEAVDANGAVLSIPITAEEDGRTRTVTKWGIRVDEQTFQSVAADKRDDGILQRGILGRKVAGKLEPDYLMPTTGAAITEW